METITLADYVQYGFLAFICLLLISMFVALIRLTKENGEIKGELRGINKRLDDLTARVATLEQTVAALGREVSETKGLIVALHQRVDLVMRHRHDPDNGQVVLTPEEVAAD